MQTQYTTSLDAINVAHVLLNLSDSGKISFNLSHPLIPIRKSRETDLVFI